MSYEFRTTVYPKYVGVKNVEEIDDSRKASELSVFSEETNNNEETTALIPDDVADGSECIRQGGISQRTVV